MSKPQLASSSKIFLWSRYHVHYLIDYPKHYYNPVPSVLYPQVSVKNNNATNVIYHEGVSKRGNQHRRPGRDNYFDQENP